MDDLISPSTTRAARKLRPMSAILPHTALPSPLQERLESLAKSFGADEEHAMLRCLDVTELLLKVKHEHGGRFIWYSMGINTIRNRQSQHPDLKCVWRHEGKRDLRTVLTCYWLSGSLRRDLRNYVAVEPCVALRGQPDSNSLKPLRIRFSPIIQFRPS
jgi:hypothetical protein